MPRLTLRLDQSPPPPAQPPAPTAIRPAFLAPPPVPAPKPLTTLQVCALRSALEAWKPHHNPPRMLNTVTLPLLMDDFRASLIPASDEVYARALSKLIEFALAFGIPCGDPAAVQRIYHEKLADLPHDLLTKAVTRVTDTWTWGNRLPMPAEIRKTISNELVYRRVQLSRAQLAMLKARDRETYAQLPQLPAPKTNATGDENESR